MTSFYTCAECNCELPYRGNITTRKSNTFIRHHFITTRSWKFSNILDRGSSKGVCRPISLQFQRWSVKRGDTVLHLLFQSIKCLAFVLSNLKGLSRKGAVRCGAERCAQRTHSRQAPPVVSNGCAGAERCAQRTLSRQPGGLVSNGCVELVLVASLFGAVRYRAARLSAMPHTNTHTHTHTHTHVHTHIHTYTHTHAHTHTYTDTRVHTHTHTYTHTHVFGGNRGPNFHISILPHNRGQLC